MLGERASRRTDEDESPYKNSGAHKEYRTSRIGASRYSVNIVLLLKGNYEENISDSSNIK